MKLRCQQQCTTAEKACSVPSKKKVGRDEPKRESKRERRKLREAKQIFRDCRPIDESPSALRNSELNPKVKVGRDVAVFGTMHSEPLWLSPLSC